MSTTDRTSPTAEQVYQAWHGTDGSWGGCADRASIFRVMGLYAADCPPPLDDPLTVALLAHEAAEPPQDAGQHPSLAVHERVGDEWAQWQRTRQAYLTLIRNRLLTEHLDHARAAAGATHT